MRLSRIIVMSLAVVGSCAILRSCGFIGPAPAQEQPKPLEPASAEYTDGFCSGFRAAVNLERTRFLLWSRQMTAGRTPDDSMVAVVEAAASYVLLQHPTGKYNLTAGKTVDCAPKPEEKPAEEPK